jgi:hypothetical protein
MIFYKFLNIKYKVQNVELIFERNITKKHLKIIL